MNKKLLPETIEQLIVSFKQFPSIGDRSAFRMVMFLIRQSRQFQRLFGETVLQLSEKIGLCQNCFNISEKNSLCSVCQDESRDKTKICIVENVADLVAIDSSGGYDGLYFVLHGLLSPIKGIGKEQLHLDKFLETVRNGDIAEVIIATDYTVEGDATALYIAKLLEKDEVSVSRIAAGIPSGGSLEYLDARTLQNALKERKKFYF